MSKTSRVVVIIAIAAVVVSMILNFYSPRRARPPSPEFIMRIRVGELWAGTGNYRIQNGLFPGEQALDLFAGNGGPYTGSQLLAACLYQYPSEAIPGGRPELRPRFGLNPTQISLFDAVDGSVPNTLSDGQEVPMAICYYLARNDRKGADRFIEGDNSVYTGAAKGGDFRAFLYSLSDRGKLNLRADDFLLVAPGRDRKYFTSDDVVSADNFGVVEDQYRAPREGEAGEKRGQECSVEKLSVEGGMVPMERI